MLVYVCICLWCPSIYLGCIHGFPEILESNKLQIEKSQKKKFIFADAQTFSLSLSPKEYRVTSTYICFMVVHVVGIINRLEIETHSRRMRVVYMTAIPSDVMGKHPCILESQWLLVPIPCRYQRENVFMFETCHSLSSGLPTLVIC